MILTNVIRFSLAEEGIGHTIGTLVFGLGVHELCCEGKKKKEKCDET